MKRRAPIVVQRKCGCGGSCGPCADEKKKKKVQRHALGETDTEVPRSVGNILGSAGHPLDAETRASMESRFGRSLADVRVHTDTHAAESAKEINAAAYTSGTHIVFGAGRFAPHTTSGRRLLAHELAHVMQQRSGTALPSGVGPADDAHERAADRIADLVVAQGPAFAPPPAIAPVAERLVRRKREDEEPATGEEEAHRLIVEDSASPAAGQMRRSEFVALLDAAICETSREEIGNLGRSTDGCPLLEQWRPRIRSMSTRQLEVSIRRWIEPDAQVRHARAYIPRITERLAESIRIWARTGSVAGVPPDLMELLAGGKIRISVGGMIKGAIGSLFRKSRDGAPAPATNVALDAGAGRPLDAGVASRMGQAFGRDFSGVRIHTGADAASEAARIRSRAFTIGNDIAFANGEYAPGTLVGDALLAHELAHVAQQEGAPEVLTKSDAATTALEHDADDAAVHAVLGLWPRLRHWARDVRANAMPRLKSSLRLQSCSSTPEEMQEYLQGVDTAKGTLQTDTAAKRARDVSEAWGEGQSDYYLTVRRKTILIRQMLDNGPEDNDQVQILGLLERSESPDLELILGPKGAIPHADLLDKFTSQKEALWRFYMRRYPLAYPVEFLSTEKEKPPQRPDLEKLNAEFENSSKPMAEKFEVVQFGEDLPETTLSSNVKTEKSTEKLRGKGGRSSAYQWIHDVYGKYFTDERAAPAKETEIVETAHPMKEVYEDCMSRQPESVPLQKRYEYCTAFEETVQGFHDRDTNRITVQTRRDSPETMLHEMVHALAHPNTDNLKHFAKEGLTEYFTRRVVMRRDWGKEKPPYLGGSYAQAYDAVQELAIIVGEDLLARVHFQGKLGALCKELGPLKYHGWNSEMEFENNSTEATKVLRGEKVPQPPEEDKEKEKDSEIEDEEKKKEWPPPCPA
ncbi:MAG TPA: DUF4157 domain-containing protein [Thermoanaerobaculia bacterium]|nr:DUF4157 domain-containing protein [Thermoanaerobaculia bacterium]